MRRAILRVYPLLAFLLIATRMLTDGLGLPPPKPLFGFPWWMDAIGGASMIFAGIYILLYGTDG